MNRLTHACLTGKGIDPRLEPSPARSSSYIEDHHLLNYRTPSYRTRGPASYRKCSTEDWIGRQAIEPANPSDPTGSNVHTFRSTRPKEVGTEAPNEPNQNRMKAKQTTCPASHRRSHNEDWNGSQAKEQANPSDPTGSIVHNPCDLEPIGRGRNEPQSGELRNSIYPGKSRTKRRMKTGSVPKLKSE